MLADVKNHFNIKDDQLDMQAPNKLTRKICEEQGVRLIDLYSSFRTNPKFPFFFRDEHLNSEGHELIASEITKALTNEKVGILLSADSIRTRDTQRSSMMVCLYCFKRPMVNSIVLYLPILFVLVKMWFGQVRRTNSPDYIPRW